MGGILRRGDADPAMRIDAIAQNQRLGKCESKNRDPKMGAKRGRCCDGRGNEQKRDKNLKTRNLRATSSLAVTSVEEHQQEVLFARK
jgi:hypothetical protein